MAETEHTKKLQIEVQAKQQAEQEKALQEAEQQKQKEKEYSEKKRKIEEYLAALPPDELEKLKKEFIESNKKNVVFQKAFERGGFENKIVKIQWYEFIFTEKLNDK